MEFPKFYNPDKVGEYRQPNLAQAKQEGLATSIKPAVKDKVKKLLVGIDLQNDFIAPSGTLKVEGAVDDLRRFVEYIYKKAEEISGLLFTLDQHLPWQIFYSLWWKDKNGKHPDPLTMISEDDVKKGKWIPQLDKKWSLEYPTTLKETNQSPLIIWPEHCMIGSAGAALVADLAEAVEWLAAARNIQPIFVFKGTVPQSEHYGAFRCCVPVPGNLQGGLQTGYLDAVAQYDVIEVVGQAEDFCVRETIKQMLEYFNNPKNPQPDVIKKMRFLRDCTSLVFPDKRKEADKILDDFAAQGVQIVKSTD